MTKTYKDVFEETLPAGSLMVAFYGDKENGLADWISYDRFERTFRAWRTQDGQLYTIVSLTTLKQIREANFGIWNEQCAEALRRLAARRVG